MTKKTKKQALITKDDVNSALNFWTHFGVPMSKELKSSSKAFLKRRSMSGQERFKKALLNELASDKHPEFKDPMFKTVRKAIKKQVNT